MLRIKDREPTFSASLDCGGKRVLQYKIVRTDDPFRDRDESEVYSLAVICSGDDGGSESCFAYDIARSYPGAERIARLLCRMTVFPENVCEVLSDSL